ncbi:hypothetical protein ACI65C_006105, partial [Semiaphis heraclei]
MIVDVEKQHGQVVWAKLSCKSMMWGGMYLHSLTEVNKLYMSMAFGSGKKLQNIEKRRYFEGLELNLGCGTIILSVKKMDLAYFDELPGKTCVWWLHDDSMSQVNNDLIFEFKSNIKRGMTSLNTPRRKSVEQAIYMLSTQFNFVAPRSGEIKWALKYLPSILNGKRRRKEEFIIPDDILHKIIMANNNIRRCMEERKQKSIKGLRGKQKKKINVSEISKKGKKYCMACRMPSDGRMIEHPIFKGSLCNDCFMKGKDIILSIAKDNANDGCCVCLTQKDTLVLCSFCVRAYCNECLEFYCGQRGLEKILNDMTWTCFACNTNILKTSKLVPRSTKEQLKNIYNLYPANTEKNYAKEKIKELHIMNLKDIQNNVPKALQSLEVPFKILETTYLNDVDDCNDNIAKLVVQYYPNREDYNKDKFFDQNDCVKKFFSFLQIKNKMEAMQNDGKPIFWAFETSAAIKIGEQKTISRFLDTEPIIIGMETNDVQQRSRFIWTNITILDENIKQLTTQHIYLHKIPKFIGRRSKFYKDNIDMPWCYTSIYAILSSFVRNDV